MNERAVVSVERSESFPYVTDEPIYHRVGVKNDELSPVAAKNVAVTLVSVQPQPPWSINPLPSLIGHKGGYCQRDHCEINPGDEHLYDLVRSNSHANPSRAGEWAFQTVEAIDQWVWLVPDLEYRIELRVTGSNFRPITASLVMARDAGLALHLTLQS